jgi:hypothetical protein
MSTRTRFFGVLLTLVFGVFILITEASAASQRKLALDGIVELSQEIVVGRVTVLETAWRGRLIVSIVTVEVVETIKGGGVPPRIEITQLGGTAVHPDTGLSVTMTASSHVALAEGEDVLLFVSRTSDGLRQIVGAQQGKYAIRMNARTGERELPVGPKRLVVAPGTSGNVVRADTMTLDEMRTRIRGHVERQGVRPGGS